MDAIEQTNAYAREMDAREQTAAYAKEIDAVTTRFSNEFTLTYTEMIGVLEIHKAELLEELKKSIQEDEDQFLQ